MSKRYAATDAPVVVGTIAGEVVAFDAHAGLGYVRSEAGETYLLHCIEITDGSRDIPVGQRVEFSTVVRFGKSEAAQIVKL
jgi:CspA family cold shock protein